ncbi:DNA repair protein RecO [Metabacillus iocasae]|uniref:DNA repair protein RecO n=1 Tax=Priestia iocasae TaxID=2291674 RepID=A0ABS2QPV3_9BACI|nr:DNA repair protein RecO [Metabacillus iocasae]MBM7701488.1 DNA repair protein RecO (recombination protein O) [Metabacillus iocasae]
MFKKCEGIVIRTNDYGESNKIVTIYSRELGKVGMMARGAKKPSSRLSATTQLFTYGHFFVQAGSGMGTLHQGEVISSMRSIREDIFCTAYASYIVELTDKVTENNKPNPFLFEFLYQTLSYMNEGYDLDVLTYIYEMKMLNVLGLYPSLNECVFCQSKDGVFGFSIRDNGLICHRCTEKDPYHLRVSPGTIKLLRLFYYIDLQRLGSISVKEETKHQLKLIIDSYYEEYSGLFLKSKRFLNQMDKLKTTFDVKDKD